MPHWFQTNVEGLSTHNFRVKSLAGLREGSWRGYGEKLLGECASHDQPVLLVVNELLKRMLHPHNGKRRVDELLSWLRGVLQRSLRQILGPYQVLVISGHIGLPSVVQQLGLLDRINHLYTFRLGPWSRDASIACFHMEILAEATMQHSFIADARRGLDRLYSTWVNDIPERIASVLDVLEHDGYLESGNNGHRFASKLLKD